MTRTVTSEQRGISLTRLALACLTCGLSLLFTGVRRRRRTVTRTAG
jgi:hypothetical protein